MMQDNTGARKPESWPFAADQSCETTAARCTLDRHACDINILRLLLGFSIARKFCFLPLLICTFDFHKGPPPPSVSAPHILLLKSVTPLRYHPLRCRVNLA